MARLSVDGEIVHSTNGLKYRLHDVRWWQFGRKLWLWWKRKRTGSVGYVTITLTDGTRREVPVTEETWFNKGD